MTITRSHAYFSPEEYLELERMSSIKHEYIYGEVYAMAGASDAHVTIAINLLTLLRTHVRGSNCRIYSSDMKVYIESANAFYYPDGLVTCDQRDTEEKYFKRYPRLIVEVLSSTTENFDRNGKFRDYQQLDTLQEYVLISQDKMQVECWRRSGNGDWVTTIYESGSKVELVSLDFNCAIADLYEDVELSS